MDAMLTLHVHVQLVPERAEVVVELGPRARLQGRRTAATAEHHAVFALDAARSARQHDDAVGHRDRLADVVRDQQHRLALGAQHLHHLVGDGQARLRIQGREGLVQQHDVRLGDQGARQRHPLAHAAGELARIVVEEGAHAALVQQVDGALARLFQVPALNLRTQHRVVQDRAPLEQVVLLQHVAHARRRPRDGRAVHADPPGRRLQDARDQGQQRALAAAGLPDQADELARAQPQVDAVERLRLAGRGEVAQRDVAQLHARRLRRGKFLEHRGHQRALPTKVLSTTAS
jgi:hypothetical protein